MELLPTGWGWWAIFGAIIAGVVMGLYPPFGNPSLLGLHPVQWGALAILVLGGVILLSRGTSRIRERLPKAFGRVGGR